MLTCHDHMVSLAQQSNEAKRADAGLDTIVPVMKLQAEMVS